MSAAHPVAVWEIHASAAWPEYIGKVSALLPEVDIFSINQTEGRRLLGLTDIYSYCQKACGAWGKECTLPYGEPGRPGREYIAYMAHSGGKDFGKGCNWRRKFVDRGIFGWLLRKQRRHRAGGPVGVRQCVVYY